MPFDRGRHFLAIPGPSVIPDEVLRAMHWPAINIYEGPLIDLTNQAGAAVSEAMSIVPGGDLVWSAPDDELVDAQITAFVHARLAQRIAGRH